MLITASSLQESLDHFALCEKYPDKFYSTVGVHPCTVAQEFYIDENRFVDDIDDRLLTLRNLVLQGVEKGNVRAFGEIGLDYDRLHYSTKQQQLTMFKKQLEIVGNLDIKLPLFLHMRNACDDFINTLKPFINKGSILPHHSVVHSFTGTQEELTKLLDLGFFIGINGCSLKTEENLRVACLIPHDKLLIETDAPWCEIRKSHAGYKYITPYPNKFYSDISHVPLVSELQSLPQGSKKSPPLIKLDDLLPFPSIKKENFEKHVIATKQMGHDIITSSVLAPLIKSRNEPVFVGLVAEILCKVHNLSDKEIEVFLDTIYDNSCRLFLNHI